MADASVDVLVVGTGVAGTRCAEELRAQGFEGTIALVGRELDAPYERPPVSKDLLQGTRDKASLALHPKEWYAEQGIELRTRASVMGLDLEARTAKLPKEELGYDRLLVATGAQVRRLPVDGVALDGVHVLRAPGNSAMLRRDAEAAERVVVVGGSYIACEVAASLTAQGKAVTMVMEEDQPLSRHFGAVAGGFFARLLTERGVELVGGDPVDAFLGEGEGDDAKLRAVRTRSGREVAGTVAVVGVGAVPDVQLAKKAGLELGATGGVRCDATLAAVGADRVWAAGDMCEWDSALHGGPARVEHWEVAAAQGRHAARAMLGDASPYVEVPAFWSDLADWVTLDYVGIGGTPAQEEVRGDVDGGAFSVWFRDEGGALQGVLAVGRPDDLEEGRAEVAARAGG